jgi:hypothetical protein
MMTVGGNPFQIARPSGARRARLRGWLPLASAMLGAAILAVGMSSSAWARPSGPLATTVWVANGGAFNAGSLVTFAGGSSRNSKPLFFNVGPDSLLQSFPGSPFLATGPTGVALTPDSDHVSVVGQLIDAVLTYTPTANGDVPPETLIAGPDTGLASPAGDAYGMSPYYFDTQANQQQLVRLVSSELYVTNINSSVTEYPEGASGDYYPDEIIGGDPTVTFLAEPVGIYVDTAQFYFCTPYGEQGPSPNPSDLCNYGMESGPVNTRRVWVVNRFLGIVTIYVPEVACDVYSGFCRNGNGSLPSNFAEQPPLGGVFPTTTDGEFPPIAGGSSTDPTNPNFIAVQPYATYPEIYITDLAGGYHNKKGRIKFFFAYPYDQCLESETDGDCLLALRGAITGLPDGQIGGMKTLLNKPMGIVASSTYVPSTKQSSEYTDNLIVTNVDANNLVQFSSSERGNIPPDAFIRGKKTKLLQPTGIGISMPSMIWDAKQP